MLVDVTQDGAGYSSLDNGDVSGFLTEKVESCSVYVFFGDEGYSIVHDTGQLKYSEIAEFAKQCGKITGTYYGVNLKSLDRYMKDLHKNRRDRIKNLLKIKIIEKVDLPSGIIAVLKDGSVISKDKEISGLKIVRTSAPDKKRRENINYLNNLFHPTNKQSLSIDIQYNNGESFTDIPKLLYSFEYMTEIAKKKSLKGDLDFQNALYMAQASGIILET